MSKKTTKAVPNKAVLTDKKPAVTNDKQLLIYLGPTIPGVAKHANVYSNGLPLSLQKAVSDTPMLCRLIVPISEAVSLQKELNRKTSATANIYKAVVAKYL